MSPQIEKQQFRNTTDGWVGVTVIGPKGEDRGAAVEPGGTVWLSEPEQILTANAPRRPEDNPFVEQTRMVTDPETGESVPVQVTPLVPADEGRFVPAQERFVPGVVAEGALGVARAQAAATGNDPTTVTTLDAGALQRHAEVDAMGADALPGHRLKIQEDGTLAPPPVPPRAAAAAAAAAPEPPEEPSPAPAPPVTPEEPSTPPQEPPVPPVEEETAAVVDPTIGEETGAAVPPSGAPVQGEYAMAEEVGTPSAPDTEMPAAGEPDGDAEQASQPAPYSPPQE